MVCFIYTSQSTFFRKTTIANLPLNQRDLRTYSLYGMKHDEETFKQVKT